MKRAANKSSGVNARPSKPRIKFVECATAYDANTLADRMSELAAVGYIPQGSVAVCPIGTYANGDVSVLFSALMVLMEGDLA